MRTLEFLGITFRSAQHQTWFLQSMAFLLGGLVWFALAIKVRCLRPYRTVPWRILWQLHLIAAYFAHRFTKGGELNGDIFSRDCIWFNSLLGVMYLCLWARYRTKQ